MKTESSYTAVGDRVAVHVDEDLQQVGSIFIPEVAQDRARTGVIAQVGGLVKELRAGLRIGFPRFCGIEITVDGETLLIMREEEVLGVYDSA